MVWLPFALVSWACLTQAHRDSVKKSYADTRTIEVTADQHFIQHNYDHTRRHVDQTDQTKGGNEELGVRLQRVIKALKVITSPTGAHTRPSVGISEIGLSGPGPVITDEDPLDSRIAGESGPPDERIVGEGGFPDERLAGGLNLSEGLISLTPQDQHAEIHLQPEQIVPQGKALVGLRTDPESMSDPRSKTLGEIHLQPEQIDPNGAALMGLHVDPESKNVVNPESKSLSDIHTQPEHVVPDGEVFVGLRTDPVSKSMADPEIASLSGIHNQQNQIVPEGETLVELQTDPESKSLLDPKIKSLGAIHLQPEQIVPQGKDLRTMADRS